MQYFVFILEIIGTVAFALSGAIVGIRKHMDCFGVSVLGLTAACGGGLIRDILLGQLPPAMFRNSVYAFTAIGTSLLLFVFAAMRVKYRHQRLFDVILLVADSLGLGIFTVVGAAAVYNAGYGDNMFFTVFLAAVTGVGGGLLRDVMAEQTPYIFVKHIYACASIVGAVIYCLTRSVLGEGVSMIVGSVSVVAIRLLAAHFRWSLPKVKDYGKK